MMQTSLKNLQKRFECWREIYWLRRELREHGAAICKDIGISRATLDFEANRPFWKEDTETPDSFHRNRKFRVI